METPNKYVIGGVVAALAVSFAAGRWSAPVKVVTETKTVVQQDTSKQVNSDQDKHTKTNVIQVKRPDGTVITKTTRTTDTDTKKTVQQDVKTNTETNTKTEITKSSSPLTVMGMVGTDVTNLSGGLIYGASVYRPVVGPICVGVWGMSNKTGGFSLGIQF